MINDNISNSDFLTKLPQIEEYFNEIYAACNNDFWRTCGSYLFDGQNYQIDERMRGKQILMYEAAKLATNALEVGTYMGHSAFLMLIANPTLNLTLIDPNTQYTPVAANLLKTKFPNATINFYNDSSVTRMVLLEQENTPKFDFFHIDGSHNIDQVRSEFNTALTIANKKFNIIVDDTDVVPDIADEIKKYNIVDQYLYEGFAPCNFYSIQLPG